MIESNQSAKDNVELTLQLLVKCLHNHLFHSSILTTYPDLSRAGKTLRQKATYFLFPATPLQHFKPS